MSAVVLTQPQSDLSPPRIKQEFSYLMGEKQTASH